MSSAPSLATRQYVPALRASFDRLRAEAGSALGQRDDNWREAAEQIAGWLEMERKADRFGSELQDVDTATAWMKKNAETLRNQRLEPLAAQARATWAKLRQNSSIDLDAITLSGQPTRGRVHLKASVDGVETEALPVMSQGELNAVALALFLPRATMAASPLRFVVLDDPVQAMDPEKVDGLTEVLVDRAKERQVGVFTHDDRLTESVRRTAPGARIVNVERGIGSTVEVRECQSPSLRYLDDAHNLLDDDQVPDEVLGRAIPGYARLAVEAAAHESYFRRRLTAGDPRRDVEAAWTRARKTTQRIALAVSADGRQDHSTWSRSRRYREQTVALCGREVHRGMRRTARDALLDARKTVRDLLDGTS